MPNTLDKPKSEMQEFKLNQEHAFVYCHKDAIKLFEQKFNTEKKLVDSCRFSLKLSIL